ncbi:MAG: glycosyl transferase [Oscillospiraceae bacterium]|nr:glycosyl transferase [Oscillospiraceae bacterium]
MKHAFLVIAHSQFEILGKLMSLLDDYRCDFYIHIDKKSKSDPREYLESIVKESKVRFIDRISVNWGGYSIVECTLNLLESALPSVYDYYHLLSGVDLPIKTKDEILEYFDKHNDTQFVSFERPIVQEKYVDRLRYHSFFQDTGSSFLQGIDRCIRQFERIIKYDRLRKANLQVQFGSNWFSITHDFADWTVKQKQLINQVFRNTRCSDELFIQTMLINSPYLPQVEEHAFQNDCRANLRLIDWKRGRPYVFHKSDLEELLNSPCLFARKFDMETDPDICEALYDSLRNSTLT